LRIISRHIWRFSYKKLIEEGMYSWITIAYTYVIIFFVPSVVLIDLVMALLSRIRKGA